MIYLSLFWEFFKTGLFTVGGGLATLPFFYDISDRLGWFTYQEIADMIAISESTPGAFGVNMASYAGFTTAGVPGAVTATFGIIAPSLIIVLIIASFIRGFQNNFYVSSALYGLRPASLGLITASAVSVLSIALLRTDLFKQTGALLDLFDFKCVILAAVIWIATNLVRPIKELHPLFFIAVSAATGVVFKFAGA